ncbi:unnamed protein product, partial [Iphiclides podalirius]
MGSGASGLAESPGADLRLPTTGLRFTVHQLRTLNSYVEMLHEEDQKGRMSLETECVVEDIVQRIVDGAGQRDPRFRCCHLIALHRHKKMRSRSLEYIVTLDSLPTLNGESEECRLQNGPLGYGKVRLTGREADKWAEFLTPAGYLCRDKVVERWVQLLARSGRARGGGGSRVQCARAAARARPLRYCYLQRGKARSARGEYIARLLQVEVYGALWDASSPERRLAIVEGAAWVMVRVGAGEAEAKLVLGARVGGCSAHAYTTRVPMTHPMALLHYTAAQGGYYAVAIGPPSPTTSGERGVLWQLWQPSLEATLDTHFSDQSAVARVAGALNSLIDNMRDGVYQQSAVVQGCPLLLSRYVVWCQLQRRLVTVARPAALRAAFAAHHLLLILDSLVRVCERGGAAGLVFPAGRECVARRGAAAADWGSDAACLRRCLLSLQQRCPAGGDEIPRAPSELLETALFHRWESLNREARALAPHNYSGRQLRYLGRVANELMSCKNMTVDEEQKAGAAWAQDGVERLVHVMAVALDQARELHLEAPQGAPGGQFDLDLAMYRSKKWKRLRDYYDASSACLIDAARRDPELRERDLADGVELMRNVLRWLGRAAKEDKKHLGPVLGPYLDAMFLASLENCWFLEEFEGRRCVAEYQGLGVYCAAVHRGDVEPCLGLLEAAKKLAWAKAMVDFVDRFRHVEFRLVFPTGEGLAVSYPVGLGAHQAARRLALSGRDKADAKLRLATRCVVGAFHHALLADRGSRPRHIKRHESSEEILNSVKSGHFWRSSAKPDIIPAGAQDASTLDSASRVRRSRADRSASSYGFPEISITDRSDAKTLRRKYHTLKSLVYTEPVESIKEMKRRPRSASSTLRKSKALSRPSILETLDFINGVRDALYVEESGASEAEESWSGADEWLLSQTAPANFLAGRSAAGALHAALGDLVPALLQRARFTVLQELCSFLGDSSEGALFALHRLARAARSRSSERAAGVPEEVGTYQARYRQREDCDTPPQPPPLPRRHTCGQTNELTDHEPSKRLQELEHHLDYLQRVQSRLNINRDPTFTGVINPIYVRIPKDRFAVKRSKSLGRSTGCERPGLEVSKCNLTLGTRSGSRTNDVVTAMRAGSHASGLFSRCAVDRAVGGSYKPSRVTVD